MSSSRTYAILFSGITSGAVYAFVALAFSVTFNSSGIVNFAQGQFVMIGGMVASSLHTAYGISVFPAMLLGVAAASAAGLIMGVGFVLPMLALGEFTLILVTLGLGNVIEGIALAVWGNRSALRCHRWWTWKRFALAAPISASIAS